MRSRFRKLAIIILAVIAVTCLTVGLFGCKPEMPAPEVTVTFYSGQEVFATSKGLAGTAFTGQSGEREGYEFGGWFTDPELKESYTLPETFPASDLYVYGLWTAHSYTIAFDSGNGAGIMEPIAAEYGKRVKLPKNQFQRRSEEFEGWALERGGEAVYADEASVTNLTADQNGSVTLYACFDVFNIGDFTIEDGAVTGYTGKDENIKLPAAANRVAPRAFVNNGTLKKVVVPDHYTEIGKGAFQNCTSLEKLTLPFVGQNEYENTFLSYLFGAQSYKDNFFKIYARLSNGSLYLDDMVYSENHVPASLKTVVVTRPATSISEGAFYGCYGLTKVVYSDYSELAEIGKSAFENCPNLGYDSETQTVFRLDFTRNATVIRESAFSAYATADDKPGYSSYILTMLQEIAPLEKVETVEAKAFYNCLYLNGVTFGENLSRIGSEAFFRAASLHEVAFPDSAKSIGDFSFAYCIGLNTVKLGEGVETIGEYAFAACSSLFQVTVGSTRVPAVGNIPFSNDLQEISTATGTSLAPVFNKFRIYAGADQLADVKSAFGKIYEDYIYAKHPVADPFYFWEVVGGYAAKFHFTEGWVVYVEDPQQKFLSEFRVGSLDDYAEMGYYYPMLVEEFFAETYEGVRLYRISNPAITDYPGEVIEETLRVMDIPYAYGGENYMLPVAKIRGFDKTYGTGGTNAEGAYYLSESKYGIVTVKRLEKDGMNLVPKEVPAPAGTRFAVLKEEEFQKLYSVTYYDANFDVLEVREFFVDASGTLWMRNPESAMLNVWLESYVGGRRDYVFLSGDGVAEISDNGTLYTGNYTAPQEGLGTEGYTVSLTNLKLKNTQSRYTATAKFYGYFNGIYHRCDMSLNLGAVTEKWSLFEYADAVTVEARNIEKNFWDYEADAALKDQNSYYYHDLHEHIIIDRHVIYVYYDSTGKFLYGYTAYQKGDAVKYGTCEIKEDGYSLHYADEDLQAQFIEGDKRGSFIVGDTPYYVYDSDEDFNYYILEDYGEGQTIFYYVVKLDGYGNAYFRDCHDDNIDFEYFGTYYNTGRVVVKDDFGLEYYEFAFVAETGETFFFVPDLYFYYDISYKKDPDKDDSDEKNWVDVEYGQLLAVVNDNADATYTVLDEFGFKIAEVSVDAYGVTSLKQFTYTFGSDGAPIYEEKASSFIVRYLRDSNGNIVKFAVYDERGVFLYYFIWDKDAYVVEYDAEVVAGNVSSAILPDVTELRPFTPKAA